MNMKIVSESLRNSYEALSTQNLIILRNFQCWPQFLVSYIKYVYSFRLGQFDFLDSQQLQPACTESWVINNNAF